MPCTILITGFGPFPTAPVNPTAQLVARLARTRRPALADTRLLAHVFTTSYRAVDSEFPRLLAAHAPDAILMFGLAARRRGLTIETRARNAISVLLADSGGSLAARRAILPGAPSARPFAPWVRKLVHAVGAQGLPARLSHDAGRYVCNYLCWQALDAAARQDGPLVAFVHVPQLRRRGRPLRSSPRQTLGETALLRAGEALLLAVAATARRHSSGRNATYI